MNCNHEKIKSVNCALFCAVCGAALPPDALRVKENTPEETKPAEGPKAPAKRKRGSAK